MAIKLKTSIPWGKDTLKVADHKVAFAGNPQGLPLGKLNEKQLEDLAIIALESGNPSLLDLFEGDLPSLDDLKKKRVAAKTATLKPSAEENKPQ